MRSIIKTRNKGITLIALVITIIVLLILAGVTIATLTGEDGILTKAQIAKNKTNEAEAREKVQIAVMGSYGADGKISVNELKENLKQTDGVTGADGITKLPATVTVDGYQVTIDEDGKVTVDGEDNSTPPVEQKSQLEKTKEAGTVLSTTDNTTITDDFGNQIVVPAGFKIGSESATDVTGGVVIEDVSHTAIAGSEFVWVPVGKIYTDVDKTEEKAKTITLGRYVFKEDGTIDEDLSKTEPSDELKVNLTDIYYYTEGLKTETTSNTHAIDIETFITKANSNNGYYIGRYETRTTVKAERTSSNKNDGAQATVRKEDYIYNYITQPESARLSQNMYSDSNFTSDLVNSYAWDTAILFLQTFDNRANKTEETKPYSRQNSLNTSLANQGTNNLPDTTKQDKICNICDMASNTFEWTTETSSCSDGPCTGRGGDYNYSNYYTAYHSYGSTTHSSERNGFRVLLYL